MDTLQSLLQELQASQLRDNFSQINELQLMSGGVAQILTNESDMTESGYLQRQEMQKQLRAIVRSTTAARAPSFHPTPVGAADIWKEVLETSTNSGRGQLPTNALTTMFYGLEPNGWTVTDDAGEILAIDLALEPILNYLNFAVMLAKQRVINTGGLTEHYFRSIIAPYLLYFVIPAKPSALPSLNAMTQPAYLQMKAATREQLRFICAHEVGHALLGHNDEASITLNLSSEHDVKAFARHQEMEFEADAEAFLNWNYFTAMRAARDIDRHESSGQPPGETPGSLTHSQQSLELLFAYLGSIELTREVVTRSVDKGRVRVVPALHPPAQERLGRLRQYWGPAALDHDSDGRLAAFGKDVFIDTWGKYLKSLGISGIRKLTDEIQNARY